MAQYNSLDFDDMNFSDDLDLKIGEGGRDKPIKGRGPVTQFGASTLENTRDELLNGRNWKNAVTRGLPGPFRETWEAYDATSETLSGLYDQAQKEIVDPVRKIAKTIDDAVPNNVPLIKTLTSKVAAMLKKEGSERSTSANRVSSAEDDGIALMLKETFEKSTEIEGLREESREKRELLRDSTREALEKNRSDRETRIWGRIDKNIQTISLINKNVGIPYQKKSLEIQARSYMTLGRILKETKDAREENRGLLESIRHNTGIPEAMKIRLSDEFKDQVRKKAVGSVRDRMFGDQTLFNKALSRMKADASSFISTLSSTVAMASMGADAASDMSEMIKDMPKAEAAGMVAGIQAGSFIREKILKKFFSSIEKNENIMAKGYQAANAIRSPKDLLSQIRDSEFVKKQLSGKNSHRFEQAFSYVEGLFDLDRGNGKLDSTAGLDGQLDPANYTRRTQIVQNKVVPGYLARILREIQVIRTGNEKVQMTVFDPASGTFKDASTAALAVARGLARDMKTSRFTSQVGKTAEVLLDGDESTPDAVKAAKRAAASFAEYGGPLTDEAFKGSSTYKKATEAERAIYDKMLSKMSGKDYAAVKYKNKVLTSRDDLRQNWESMSAKIQAMIDAGQEEELLQLGLISRDKNGAMKLNRKAIMEFQTRMAGGERFATSDINAKEGFSTAPQTGFLSALKKIPISKWFYKGDKRAEGKKIGPMAQDVQRELGDEVAPGGKKLDLVSMNGVLMSAVKELGIKVEDLFKNKTAAAPAPEAAAASAAEHAGDAGAGQETSAVPTKTQRAPRFNPRTTTNRHLFNVHKELFTLRTMLETRGVFGLGIGQFQFKNIMKDMKFPGFDFSMDGLKNVGERFKPLVKTGNDFLDSLQVAVGAGLKSALGAGNSLYQTGKSMADKAGGFIKERYENNKDWMYESGGRFIDDALKKGAKVAGKAWKFGTETLPNFVDAGIRSGVQAVVNAKNFLVTAANGPKDVYVAGNPSPVLLASKMRAGYYKNAITGKVIRNIDDLLACKDDIADGSSFNEVVLRKEDAAKGLFDQDGKELRSLMSSLGSLAMGAAGWAGSKIYEGVKALTSGEKFFKNISDSIGSVKSFFDEKLGKVSGFKFFDGRMLGLLAQIRDLVAYRKPKKIVDHVYGRKNLTNEEDITGSNFRSLLAGAENKKPDAPDAPIAGDAPSVGPLDPSGGGPQYVPPSSFGDMAKAAMRAGKAAANKVKKAMAGAQQQQEEVQSNQTDTPAVLGNGSKSTPSLPNGTKSPLLLGGPSAKAGALATAAGDVTDVPFRDIPGAAGAAGKAGGLFSKIRNSGMFNKGANILGKAKNGDLVDKAIGMLVRVPGASKLSSFVRGKGGLLGMAADVAGGIGGLLGKAGSFLGSQMGDDTYEDQGPIFGESAFANNLNQNVRQIGSLGQGKRGVIAFNDKTGRGDRDNGLMDQLQIRENQQKEQKMQVALRAEAARKEAQQNAFRYKTENVIDKMAKGVGNLLSNIGSGSSSMLSTLGNVLESVPGLGSIWKVLKGIGGKGAGLFRGAKAALTGARGAAVAAKAAGLGSRILTGVRGALVVAQAAGVASGSVSGLAVATGATALKVIGGLLVSPFVLKAAAVAAVGYGLYKGYKYFTRNSLSEDEKLRAAQYGFTSESKDLYRLMNLEGFLLDGKVLMTPGNISINYAQIKLEDLYDMFDIKAKDKEAADSFNQWFRYRFEPFFIRHLNALAVVDKTKKLDDVKKLDAEKYEAYMKSAMFLDGPYEAKEHPMKPGESLPNTKEDVEKIGKGLIDKKKLEKGTDVPKSTLFPLFAAATKAREAKRLQDEAAAKKAESDRLNQVAKNSALRAGPKAPIRDINNPDASSMQDVLKGEDGGKPPLPATGTFGTSKEKKLDEVNPGTLRKADGPMGDKGRGLPFIELSPGANFNGLNGKVKDLLLAMAAEYGQKTGNKIRLTDGFRTYKEQADIYARMPQKAAKPGNSIHETGFAFDMDSKSADELDKLGLMRKYGFTRPVGGEGWHVEPAGIQTDIQRARKDPAWAAAQTEASPGRGGGGFGSMPGSTLKSRNPSLAKKLFEAGNETIVETPDKTDKVADAKPSVAFAKSVEKPDAVGGGANGTVTSVGGVVQKNAPEQVAANGPMKQTAAAGGTGVSGAPMKGELGQPMTPPGGAGDTAVAADMRGDDASKPTSGGNNNGGGLKAIIAQEAPKVPIEPAVLQLFAAAESSMGKNTKPHMGGARGPFQFMPDTWNEQIQKHGSKYGITPGTPPEDPKASTLLAGKYLTTNVSGLKSLVGEPDIVDMYTTHFLGPTGAKTFASMPDDQIAANVMPRPARYNANIFYADGNKKTQPLTKGEIRKNLEEKFKKLSSTYGISMPKLRKSGEGDSKESSPLAAAPIGATEASAPDALGSAGSSPMRSNDVSTAPKEAPAPNMFSGRGPIGQGVTEGADTMTAASTRKKPAVEAQTDAASGMDRILDRVATSNETLASSVQNDVVPLLQGIHSTLQKMFEKGGTPAQSTEPESKQPNGPMFNRPAQKVASTSVIDRDRKYG